MKTRLISVDPLFPQSEIIQTAAVSLLRGELVAFPTETVYGLGANALDAAALRSIFAAKERPTNDPIIAHISKASQLKDLAMQVPPAAKLLCDAFWPGPLTLILKRAPQVPAIIAEGRDTIAVRMPANPIARALLHATGVPIGAPSANTFTRPSATTAEHVYQDLAGRIPLILDGGPSTIGVESTVLDLSGTQKTILRPGGITLETLRAVCPDVVEAPSYLGRADSSDSPGQMLKHYSPKAEILLFRGESIKELRAGMYRVAQGRIARGERVGALVSNEDALGLPSGVEKRLLGAASDLSAAAQTLFAGMRALDSRGVDCIVVRDPGRVGLGAALWDRLLRAAEGSVIDV